MSKTQDQWPLGEAKRKEQPVVAALNRSAESIHGGLVNISSSIRLSLTLRIAIYYAWQLLKSTVLLFAVLLIVASAAEMHRASVAAAALDNIYPADGSRYTHQQLERLPFADAWLLDEPIADNMSGFRERVRMNVSYAQQREERCIVLYRETQAGSLAAAYSLTEFGQTIKWLLIAVAAVEVYRVLLFLKNRNRLKPVVVQPITDMAEKAAAISANNLDDRINVEGAKNELKDLALVINDMLDRIEVSYNSQKQFVSDASHELRTPIAVIQGYVNMLQRWGKNDAEVLEEGINAIEQEAAAMKELVERLLFLARHDKQSLMLEMTTFDPLDIMAEIHREAKMLSAAHDFSLNPAQSALINGDKDMIKQLLRILLDNAIKYTPEGGSITLGVKQERNQVVLSVSDTGCGIAAEDLPRVFERFYRCDESRKAQTSGHGLGLSIARIIVTSHGGKLKVRSKVGNGTTFLVMLPSEEKE